MAIRLNEDKELVAAIKQGLKEKDGYCPCRIPKLPEFKCICEEFKAQMADPEFEGYCHCMLYYKSKEQTGLKKPAYDWQVFYADIFHLFCKI